MIGNLRCNHEVFDQLLRPVRQFAGKLDDGVALDAGTRLDRLELQRAMLMTRGAQALGRAVLNSQVVGETGDRPDRRRHRARPFEPRADAAVRELGAVAHRRGVHARRPGRPRGVDRHLDHDRQAVLVLAERREIGAQALG
jgi:hypothetical protein